MLLWKTLDTLVSLTRWCEPLSYWLFKQSLKVIPTKTYTYYAEQTCPFTGADVIVKSVCDVYGNVISSETFVRN